MRKFKVVIRTDVEGSECETVIELPDDVSEANIEEDAQEAAFDMVEWYWEEIE